jgi:hypothetical protein
VAIRDSGPAGAIEPSAFQPLGSAEQKPPRQVHTGRWLLAACALVFGLVMLFLLSARSLQVVVVAATPAQVSLDGIALPFGNRYLLRPGTYTVHASAEGYHPLETSVTVDDRDSQSLQLELQLLPGLVSIDRPLRSRQSATCRRRRNWTSPAATSASSSASSWRRAGLTSASTASPPAPASWWTARRWAPPRQRCN